MSTIKKPTRKEQNAIKEARLMGKIIGEFILTKPKAYKLVSDHSQRGNSCDQKKLHSVAMQLLKDAPRAQKSRIIERLSLNFKLFTGYGTTSFDSRLETEGKYAQFDVTEVPFIFKHKEINELFDIAERSLSFIHGGDSWKEKMILLTMHTFDAANKIILKQN